MFRMDMQVLQRQVRWEATQTAKDADPVTWWKTWGLSSCPELMTVAMCVLAQPCSASSAERVWLSCTYCHQEQDVKGAGQEAGGDLFQLLHG